ncbi:MAG: putative YccA/Bax inhibitor family protein [Candidatus Poriferisodalaceae bacterium]|jgi:uncharacterized YccA/Bax inhibitor family protein
MSKNALLSPEALQIAPVDPNKASRRERISDGPISGGPISGESSETLTMGGVASATGVLLVLLLGGAWFGWNSVDVSPFGVQLPSWVFGAILGGIALLFAAYFKPKWAKVIAPAYAIIEGLVVGAISHLYEFEFDGIVLQAAGLTVAIFASMLFLYGTGIVKVTDKLRRGVMAATMGIMLMYGFQILMSVLGVGLRVPYLHDSGPIGIGISLLIIGVAAFNYLLDFDFITKAEAAGAPKGVEWLAALGLLVTTVWLYLELLRLLSKLRD